MSRSTSSPVRYSRCRRSALGSRLGGGTFPFTMVGAPSWLAVFAFVFIDPAYHTFPFMGINGQSHLRNLEQVPLSVQELFVEAAPRALRHGSWQAAEVAGGIARPSGRERHGRGRGPHREAQGQPGPGRQTVRGRVQTDREGRTGGVIRQTMEQILAPTRAEPGNVTFDLHQDADDPRTFFLYERWRSVDDLADHLHAPYIQEAFKVYAVSAAGEGSAMFGTSLPGA